MNELKMWKELLKYHQNSIKYIEQKIETAERNAIPEIERVRDEWERYHSDDMTFEEFYENYSECSECGSWTDEQCLFYTR